MQDSADPTAARDDAALTPIVLPAEGAPIVPGDSGAAGTGTGGPSSEASTLTGERIDAILDRIMSVHRPAVLAHLRGIRARHPEASPETVQRILERRYLATVTTSGAGVGVAAAVPAIGTGAALALSGAETVLFLESTALFAQSVAELHGIPVDDPDRGRALVLAMVVGGPAQELISPVHRAGDRAGPREAGVLGHDDREEPAPHRGAAVHGPDAQGVPPADAGLGDRRDRGSRSSLRHRCRHRRHREPAARSARGADGAHGVRSRAGRLPGEHGAQADRATPARASRGRGSPARRSPPDDVGQERRSTLRRRRPRLGPPPRRRGAHDGREHPARRRHLDRGGEGGDEGTRRRAEGGEEPQGHQGGEGGGRGAGRARQDRRTPRGGPRTRHSACTRS